MSSDPDSIEETIPKLQIIKLVNGMAELESIEEKKKKNDPLQPCVMCPGVVLSAEVHAILI